MKRRKRWPRGTWMRVTSKETLKALMVQRGFSLERMARYAACSKSMVGHLTTGHKKTCSPELAERIAEALDVPLELLFVPQVSTQEGRIANTNDTQARSGAAA